ncbi:retrovirus-related pol polyprotein from transposon TNT 1-94 [Tanacetum coccineum]
MAAVEVPQTLEYRGGQLNVAPVLEVENFTNWKRRFMCHILAKSTWDDLILYHEGPSNVKESRVMDLKLCYNTFKFKKGETLTQTFTRYKALMNELVNDGIKLSKLEINTGFINGLPKKWLSFCQSLRNTNHVKDSELASLFGKLKYEENLIDSIYETEKNKSLVSATPLSTAFISTSIVQDFQDSPDDEEDTRSSHEYLNDLEEEYQARALLAKSKRFFKKGTQRFSSAKATDQTECHKCGKKAKYNKVKAKLALLSSSASASKAITVKNKGLIAEAYECDEEEVSLDDNEMVEVKVLIALAEENNVVSKEGARNGECMKISMRKVHTLLENLDYLCIDLNYVEEQRNNLLSKHKDLVHELNACKEQHLVLKQENFDFLTMHSNKVNQCISEQIPSQKKRILGVDHLTKDPSNSGQKDRVFVKSSADDTKVSIPGIERPWLSKVEGFILLNHDTGRILLAESQRNTADLSVVITDSSATEYNSADESSVCSTPLHPLKKLDGVVPTSGSKTIKSILRSKSTFRAEALKGVKINKPSLAPTKGNKSSSASKVNSAHAGKLKSVKIKDDPPLAIVIKELNNLKLQFSKNQLCRSYDHETNGHNRIISLEREINPRNPQHTFKRCEACGSSTHTTTDHYDIEWFKRDLRLPLEGGFLSKTNHSKTYLCSVTSGSPSGTWTVDAQRHMTGVKSYLHKYEEQPRPKVVFRDDSACVTEGYGSIKWISQNVSPYTPEQNGVAERKNRILIEAARTMLSGYVFSKQYWTEADHFYIHNHKDHLGKFDEKVNDGYLLGYSLVSKAIRFFNTRRQQTEETYHITFNEIPDTIKFSKPLVDNINIAENKRYPPDEYLHPYEPSQRYQTNNNDVSFVETYKCPEPIVLKTKVSSYQNGQTDQNDQSVQNDEILNDDHSEHSNHTNDEQIIDNLTNTKDIQISEHSSSLREKDTSELECSQEPWLNNLVQLQLMNVSLWIFSLKKNLKRLVAQGYNQQECIDYDETFAPVARLEAIKIFLAFATYMNFIVYQMDVKSAFLNGKIDNTLFVYKTQTDVILVQIYVDDIIFGSTSIKLCKQFAKLMTQSENSNGTVNNLGPDLSGKVVNKTQYIAMSSAEAEYVAAAGCYTNVLWMKSQLADYDIIYEKVPIFYDNTSAIAISNNPVLHSKTKHIDIRYHFIRDHILKGDIELHFIPTQYQLVDIFTNPLDEPTFKRLIVELGMLNIDSKPEASVISSKTEQTFIC